MRGDETNEHVAQRGPAEALQPMRPGEILSTALELYRRTWRTLLTMTLITLPVALANPESRSSPQGGYEVRVFHRLVATTSSWLATVGVPVAGLAMLVVLSVFAGAIIRVIATAITGEASGFRPGYRFGIARLGSLLLVSALVWLSVTAGCLLLVIPGIYVGVQLAASIPALVVEGRRGRSALARSWRLVEGQWWHAFGTIVLAWLVLGLVSAMIKVVVHAVTGPFGHGGWLVQALPVAVAALLLVPYGAAILVVLYLDLRARKERVDLEVLTADLRASAA